MAKRVSSEDFEAEVLGSDLPVVVEFYSDSCIPCKQLSPILGGLEDDYEDQVKVVKVNVNFDAGLAQKYEVAASPTFHFPASIFPFPLPHKSRHPDLPQNRFPAV